MYDMNCLNDFYSPVAMHQLTRSLRPLVRFSDAGQLVNKNRSCACPLSMEKSLCIPASTIELNRTQLKGLGHAVLGDFV